MKLITLPACLFLILALTVQAQTKLPIKNGVLLSPLNANGQTVTNLAEIRFADGTTQSTAGGGGTGGTNSPTFLQTTNIAAAEARKSTNDPSITRFGTNVVTSVSAGANVTLTKTTNSAGISIQIAASGGGSPNAITNHQTGVTLNGTFTGDGTGLTGLSGTNLTDGTVRTNALAASTLDWITSQSGGGGSSSNISVTGDYIAGPGSTLDLTNRTTNWINAVRAAVQADPAFLDASNTVSRITASEPITAVESTNVDGQKEYTLSAPTVLTNFQPNANLGGIGFGSGHITRDAGVYIDDDLGSFGWDGSGNFSITGVSATFNGVPLGSGGSVPANVLTNGSPILSLSLKDSVGSVGSWGTVPMADGTGSFAWNDPLYASVMTTSINGGIPITDGNGHWSWGQNGFAITNLDGANIQSGTITTQAFSTATKNWIASQGGGGGGTIYTNNPALGAGVISGSGIGTSLSPDQLSAAGVVSTNGSFMDDQKWVYNLGVSGNRGLACNYIDIGTDGGVFRGPASFWNNITVNNQARVSGNGMSLDVISDYTGSICTNGRSALWNSNGVTYFRTSVIGGTTWSDTMIQQTGSGGGSGGSGMPAYSIGTAWSWAGRYNVLESGIAYAGLHSGQAYVAPYQFSDYEPAGTYTNFVLGFNRYGGPTNGSVIMEIYTNDVLAVSVTNDVPNEWVMSFVTNSTDSFTLTQPTKVNAKISTTTGNGYFGPYEHWSAQCIRPLVGGSGSGGASLDYQLFGVYSAQESFGTTVNYRDITGRLITGGNPFGIGVPFPKDSTSMECSWATFSGNTITNIWIVGITNRTDGDIREWAPAFTNVVPGHAAWYTSQGTFTNHFPMKKGQRFTYELRSEDGSYIGNEVLTGTTSIK